MGTFNSSANGRGLRLVTLFSLLSLFLLFAFPVIAAPIPKPVPQSTGNTGSSNEGDPATRQDEDPNAHPEHDPTDGNPDQEPGQEQPAETPEEQQQEEDNMTKMRQTAVQLNEQAKTQKAKKQRQKNIQDERALSDIFSDEDYTVDTQKKVETKKFQFKLRSFIKKLYGKTEGGVSPDTGKAFNDVGDEKPEDQVDGEGRQKLTDDAIAGPELQKAMKMQKKPNLFRTVMNRFSMKVMRMREKAVAVRDDMMERAGTTEKGMTAYIDVHFPGVGRMIDIQKQYQQRHGLASQKLKQQARNNYIRIMGKFFNIKKQPDDSLQELGLVDIARGKFTGAAGPDNGMGARISVDNAHGQPVQGPDLTSWANIGNDGAAWMMANNGMFSGGQPGGF